MRQVLVVVFLAAVVAAVGYVVHRQGTRPQGGEDRPARRSELTPEDRGEAGVVRSPESRGSEPGAAAARPPNVVLVEICSLRYDHVGCAGYQRPTTPTIDSLAARGTFFRQCTSAASWTKPSTASIFTGLTIGVHYLYHGATPNEIIADGFVPKHVLPPGAVTMAEALAQAGYETGGFVANVNAWPVFGLHQGFHRYDCGVPRDGRSLASRCLDWLDGRDGTMPFFVFLLLYDVHNPYSPPYSYYLQFRREKSPIALSDYEEYWKWLNSFFFQTPQDWSKITPEHITRVVDLYDGQIRVADDAVGHLLNGLEERGLSESTAVVVVSDHGEQFGEHELVTHGNSLYEELLHVPLIIALPNQSGSFAVDDLVSTLDILPTVLEICGVEMSHRVQGRSLLPYLLSGADPAGAREYVFASNTPKDTCVRDRRWKLITRTRRSKETRILQHKERLFNLASARGEYEDVAAEHPEVCCRLGEERDRVVEQERKLRMAVKALGDAERAPLDEEAIRELKALGYL